MANHKSAVKRIRQSERRRKRNQHIRSGMRTQVKNFRLAVEAGDAAAAGEKLPLAIKAIRQAASKGVIPKRRADRNVSRLTKRLNALSS